MVDMDKRRQDIRNKLAAQRQGSSPNAPLNPVQRMDYDEVRRRLNRTSQQVFGARTPIEVRAGLPAVDRRQGGVVWWGTYKTAEGRFIDRYEPNEDSKFRFSNLTDSEWNRLANSMDRYYGPNRWKADWIKNYWERSIDHADYRIRGEGLRMTPFDAFDELLERDAARGLLPGGGRSGSGRGGPAITETVNLTDPGTAKVILQQSMAQYLGRSPSQKELNNFMSALRGAEEAAPRTADVSGSRQTTSGGVNAQAFGEEYAMSQEGSAEYLAATDYLDAFMGALAGPRR